MRGIIGEKNANNSINCFHFYFFFVVLMIIRYKSGNGWSSYSDDTQVYFYLESFNNSRNIYDRIPQLFLILGRGFFVEDHKIVWTHTHTQRWALLLFRNNEKDGRRIPPKKKKNESLADIYLEAPGISRIRVFEYSVVVLDCSAWAAFYLLSFLCVW